MSNVTISGNASGTATFTVQSPATSTNRTLTLPDATGTMPMFQSGTAVASTSGTTIDFTGIPSWAKRVTVIFSEMSTNSTAHLLVQIGSTTFTTSGYVSTSNDFNQTSATGGSNNTTGFLVVMGATAASILTGQMTITNITGNSYVSSGVYKYSTTNMCISAGSVTLGGIMDRVRLTMVGGTAAFDAGTVNVMWEG